MTTPVTPRELRLFALSCLRWSDEAGDASRRQCILDTASSWLNAAAAIERRLERSSGPLPDLRCKLD